MICLMENEALRSYVANVACYLLVIISVGNAAIRTESVDFGLYQDSRNLHKPSCSCKRKCNFFAMTGL